LNTNKTALFPLLLLIPSSSEVRSENCRTQ